MLPSRHSSTTEDSVEQDTQFQAAKEAPRGPTEEKKRRKATAAGGA
jgi:hypothetical protein